MAWNGLFGWLDQRSNRSDYNNLVNEYLSKADQQPQGQSAGPMSDAAPYGGGLLPWQQQGALTQQQTALPDSFFARAAGIPGYEQLAQGAQNNIGAMSRQMQNQNWLQNNMTAADVATLSEQQRQWNNLSPFQKSGLDLRENEILNSMEHGSATLKQQLEIANMNDARQREINAENVKARQAAGATKGILGKLPEGMMYYDTTGGPRMGYQPGAPGGQKVLGDITSIINGLNSMDTYRDYASMPSLLQGWTDPKLRGRAAMAHGDILAAIGKSRDLGTMQKSDLEFVSKNMFDPGASFGGSMPGSTGKAVGAVDFSREKLLSGLEQLARQHPELYSSPEAGAWRNYVQQFQQSKQKKK